MPKLLGAKIEGEKFLLQTDAMPAGAWKTHDSACAAFFWFVGAEIGTSPGHAEAWCGVHSASTSRARNGKGGFSNDWILRAHDVSGIPISELRMAAFLNPLCPPHRNARK